MSENKFDSNGNDYYKNEKKRTRINSDAYVMNHVNRYNQLNFNKFNVVVQVNSLEKKVGKFNFAFCSIFCIITYYFK